MEKRRRIQDQKEEDYRLTHNVELEIRKEIKKKKNKKYNPWSYEEEEFEELENEMNLESDNEEYFHKET